MKANGKLEEGKNCAWSLKPILVCIKICGITTCETSSSHWFRRFGSLIPILVCLMLNSFFTMYNISFEIKRALCPTGNQYAITIFKQLEYPTSFFNFFSMISNPAFILLIPLIFVFQFHFTGKWQNIVKSFKKIDKEIVLDEIFYRRCRKRCLFSILVFLTTLAGIVYPRLGSLISIFNVGKFFDLKLKSVVCQKFNVLILSNITTMPPIYDNLSLGIGIWVTSSALIVLTLFCALVWMAFLLADELNERMEEIHFTALNNKEINDMGYFLALDKGLKEFDLLNSLVENINDFFSHITIIALFYIMIAVIVGINVVILLYIQAGKLTFQVLSTLIPILIGLGITTNLCWNLKYKARKLRNKLSRVQVFIPNSSQLSVQRQLQLEAVMLQVAAQPELEIKAGYEMFDINLPLLLMLLSIFVSYFIFIFTTMNNFGRKMFSLAPARG